MPDKRKAAPKFGTVFLNMHKFQYHGAGIIGVQILKLSKKVANLL